MATVNAKNKLNITINNEVHKIPLYEGYSDFYNGKYMTFYTFNNTPLYVGVTHSPSELTVNAGKIGNDGVKYYILSRAFTKGENFESAGYFYEYISGETATFELSKVLSAVAYVPESGKYDVKFNIKWAGSYNTHKDARDLSAYRFQVRVGNTIITDTGLQHLKTTLFAPYAVSQRSEEDMRQVTKWFTMNVSNVNLNAGVNTFDLYLEMYEYKNKHAATYIEPFQVQLTYKGE